MSEGRATELVERGPVRPLLGLLGACLLGGYVGGMAGRAPVVLFVLVWSVTLATPRLRRAQIEGVAWVLLLGLASLAGLRTAHVPSRDVAGHTGIWRTLHEGRDLVGELEGQDGRYELPPGAVRDGERVELLPSRSALPEARGLRSDKHEAARFAPVHKVYGDEIRRLEAARESTLFPGRATWRRLRRTVLARLRSIEDPAARGLAAALLFGDRSLLDPGVSDLFTRTGTRHALAVSGLHVGLVASLWIWPLGTFIAWLLARFPLWPASVRRWLRPEVVRILLLLSFIPLAGAGAPVIRAALALGMMQAAQLLPTRGKRKWPRQADALSLWALAALLEWSANPRATDSISMQLSYVATLGLVLLTFPADRLLRRALPARGVIQPVWPSGYARPAWFRIPAQRLVDWTLMGLAASCAASIATLPLVWNTFGEWSFAGPFATLFLLPQLAAFLSLAWLELVWPAGWIESALAWIAASMEQGLAFFDRWPGTPVPLPLRPASLLWTAGLAVLVAASLRGVWQSAARRVAFLCWGAAILPWWNPAVKAELYVADVGNGTAAVVRLPGAGTWLFDAGSRDRRGVARGAVAPLLRQLDVGTVQVALSHGESDHAGALPWLIERFPPARWLGALPAHLAGRLPHDIPRLDLEHGRLELLLETSDAPRSLTLLRGQPGTGNEGSRSLEVLWGDQRWLLCGDAEGPGLARQLRAGLIRGPYDVLLFPHHGSDTPWLIDLLAAAQPREVWFSTSGRPAVADELDRQKIPWRSTSLEGPMQCKE